MPARRRRLLLVAERCRNDARNFAVGALMGATFVLLLPARRRPSVCSPN